MYHYFIYLFHDHKRNIIAFPMNFPLIYFPSNLRKYSKIYQYIRNDVYTIIIAIFFQKSLSNKKKIHHWYSLQETKSIIMLKKKNIYIYRKIVCPNTHNTILPRILYAHVCTQVHKDWRIGSRHER